MVGNCAARLAEKLDNPPGWLSGFAGYLAARLSPARAVALLHQLAGILADGSRAPSAVLTAARRPGQPSRGGGALTRALEAFFTSTGLTLPGDSAATSATSWVTHDDWAPSWSLEPKVTGGGA